MAHVQDPPSSFWSSAYDNFLNANSFVKHNGCWCYRNNNTVFLYYSSQTEIPKEGIEIAPAGYRPPLALLISGKGTINNVDKYDQPYLISRNGVLTARTDNNNDSIAGVTWATVQVTFIVDTRN